MLKKRAATLVRISFLKAEEKISVNNNFYERLVVFNNFICFLLINHFLLLKDITVFIQKKRKKIIPKTLIYHLFTDNHHTFYFCKIRPWHFNSLQISICVSWKDEIVLNEILTQTWKKDIRVTKHLKTQNKSKTK